ncbi:MAG: peptide ABC transporter substrate-binding protein [Chloroflexota bacterium]|nr:peptide ABC transporter substrate-binding protein [Chloroflexota bacterium]
MKLVRLLGLVLVLALALSAFGVASAQDETTLIIGWEQEPPLMRPRSDNTFASLVNNFVHRDLWDWDENREIFPVMVETVPTMESGLARILDNGKTQVDYVLKENIMWSDGTPITSADLEFTHRIMMTPELLTAGRGGYPDLVESGEVIDERTFQVTYNNAVPDYLVGDYLSYNIPILPAHILDTGANIDDSDYWRGIDYVGYGPYTLEDWAVGEQFTLTKNANWDGQEPVIDTVILRFITDSAQMVNAFENGDIDVAFNFQDSLVPQFSAVEGAEVYSTAGVYGDAVWVNLGNGGHPALADQNVRMALAHAIDRRTLAEQLVGPGVQMAPSWFPDQFLPEGYGFLEYDVDGANALLDESGWVDSNGNGTRDKDGTEMILRFFTTTRQVRMDYQVVIQEQLAAVGIGTQLYPIPSTLLFADYLERGILDTGDFDLAIFALSANPLSPYSGDTLEWFGCDGIPTPEDAAGSNGWGFCNPRFDELNSMIAVETDTATRAELTAEQYQLFFEGAFWHGLYLRPTWYAVQAGWDMGPAREVGTLSANYFNNIEFWAPA